MTTINACLRNVKRNSALALLRIKTVPIMRIVQRVVIAEYQLIGLSAAYVQSKKVLMSHVHLTTTAKIIYIAGLLHQMIALIIKASAYQYTVSPMEQYSAGDRSVEVTPQGSCLQIMRSMASTVRVGLLIQSTTQLLSAHQ